MKYAIALLCFVASVSASAAVRDLSFSWDQDLLDVDAQPIDKIDGFRLFTVDGVFIKLLPGDARQATVRANVEWGETCFKMRSFYLVGTTEYESPDSNISCRTVTPGKPKAPVLR